MARLIRRLASALAFLGLAAAPVLADVPASGTFTAAAACPAVQSIRKETNPGNVTLTPQQGYQVVSANRNPPTHYLVVVPGARPDRRWVEIGCGALAGAAPGQPGNAPAPAGGAGSPPAGNSAAADPRLHPAPTPHDTYVLAVSWEPAFCAAHTDKQECRAETPIGFDASHFTLHGLWRDPWPKPYSFCQDGPRYMADANDAEHWGDVPATPLSAAVASHLQQDMPGTLSYLDRHEWMEHGLCAGVSADAFFARATALLDALNASGVRDFFVGSVGRRLSLADLQSAFDQAFGAGTGQHVALNCAGGDITEIHLGLAGDVIGQGALPDLLAAGYVPYEAHPCRAGAVARPGG